MTILTRLRTLAGGVDVPRSVRAVAAGAAVAWGTTVAAQLADQCGEEISTAEAKLADLDAMVAGREIQLEQIRALILEEDARLGELDRVRAGSYDAVVKARAAALGWGPPVDVDQLVEYVNKDAESMCQAADVAAAIRFYFSAGGPGGGLPDINDDEPDEQAADA